MNIGIGPILTGAGDATHPENIIFDIIPNPGARLAGPRVGLRSSGETAFC